MFKQLVKNVVLNIVKDYIEPKAESPQDGYNPLNKIRDGLLHWVEVPFNGTYVWCQLRCLNATQMNECGAVTLIDIVKEHEKEHKPSSNDFDKFIEIRNIQENLCREIFNNPTFNEIEELILGEDNVLQSKKEELEKIKKTDLSGLTDEQKKDINSRIDKLELELGFILPEDTMSFCTSWGLGIDVSDIKKLSEEQLRDAAILATRGHDNPTDHISGQYTDRDKEDINMRAWSVYEDYMHVKQREYEILHNRRK
jgi:hypothetical protein